MVRPRWHDALIVAAILGLFAAGVWAMWWEDVRAFLHLPASDAEADSAARTAPSPQT